MLRSLLLRSIIAAIALTPPLATCTAFAQDGRSPSWTEEKCIRYKKGWSEALARRGAKGLGQAFLERHEAFLASGCTSAPDVCPRSGEELEMANILVIVAMNAGTASTFLPFACRK